MAGESGQEAEEHDDDIEDDDDDEQDEQGSKGGKKPGDDDEEFDKDRALRTIENQRKSEKDLKRQLKEVQAELKSIKDKDRPATEQQAEAQRDAEARAEKAEASLRKATVRTTALEEATGLGFKNPALAYKLIDPEDIDWDDDEPSNIKSLLKKVLDAEPYLKGRRSKRSDGDDDDDDADAGKGRNRSGKSFDFNDQIRQAAGH